MVHLGFCLNVSLNNESTNLRIFQIAWVSGYNHINLAILLFVSTRHNQMWTAMLKNPSKLKPKQLGIHWKDLLRGHVLFAALNTCHFCHSCGGINSFYQLSKHFLVESQLENFARRHNALREGGKWPSLFRTPCRAWLQLSSWLSSTLPDRKTEMEASI